MPALVERHIFSRGIGHDLVFLETVFQIFGIGLEHDPDAFADIIGDLFAFAGQTGHDVNQSLALQHAPF